jgi:hypothetical protein
MWQVSQLRAVTEELPPSAGATLAHRAEAADDGDHPAASAAGSRKGRCDDVGS